MCVFFGEIHLIDEVLSGGFDILPYPSILIEKIIIKVEENVSPYLQDYMEETWMVACRSYSIHSHFSMMKLIF